MKAINREKVGVWLISTMALGAIATVFWLEPIPQNTQYHNFSDGQRYLALPNFFNVISNLPFLWLGICGVLTLRHAGRKKLRIVQSNLLAYQLLFLSVAFVGVGSGYYHLEPNNDTLLWDRLPMAVGFMSLYAIIISEYLSAAVGQRLLLPLVGIGLVSVLYWWYSESIGQGDLRPYLLVQFLPVLTISIMLLCFKSDHVPASRYWLLLSCYVLAKLFEHFDYQIHAMLGIISGHSLKHLMPAIGLYVLLRAYKHSSV